MANYFIPSFVGLRLKYLNRWAILAAQTAYCVADGGALAGAECVGVRRSYLDALIRQRRAVIGLQWLGVQPDSQQVEALGAELAGRSCMGWQEQFRDLLDQNG
ncbi:MAG TPA: hypothetical protein VL147_08860 [Devosia sp.]|nr:hypothetical protein [Devosia sp.]